MFQSPNDDFNTLNDNSDLDDGLGDNLSNPGLSDDDEKKDQDAEDEEEAGLANEDEKEENPFGYDPDSDDFDTDN